MVNWRYITPGYFGALRIPIVRGRGFNEQDRDPAVFSMVLNETFARAIFGNEDPIGRHVLKDPNSDWFTVIGVARDVRNDGVKKAPAPEYWVVRKSVPDVTWRNQEPPIGWRAASIVVRSSISAQAVASSVRSVLAQVDPAMPVEISTLQQRVDGVNQGTRFNAVLLAMFALIGLLLSAVGLYGVIAFLVSESAKDIGVRMALGASPARIRRHVLLLASRWTLAGSAVGVAGALYSSRVLKTMLFGVPERDPWDTRGGGGDAPGGGLAGRLGTRFVGQRAWIRSRRCGRNNSFGMPIPTGFSANPDEKYARNTPQRGNLATDPGPVSACPGIAARRGAAVPRAGVYRRHGADAGSSVAHHPRPG